MGLGSLFKKKDKGEGSTTGHQAVEHGYAGQNCYFTIQINGEPAGHLVFHLYDEVTPLTARNFRELCTGQNGFGYAMSGFHRIIPGFMIQGGDFTAHNGTGGKSIYKGRGGKFDDENFAIRHTRSGLLSMANAGPNTNGSQFFVTTVPTPHLDGKHVVFGEIVGEESMNLLRRIESLGAPSGKPKAKVGIAACGVLPGAKKTAVAHHDSDSDSD